MAELGIAHGNALEYASAEGGRRHSAWSLVGFALAVVMAAMPAAAWWTFWEASRSGATQIGFGITPLYYVTALPVAVCCVIGMRRGAKLFGTLGLVILAIAVAAMVVIVVGSPW